MRHIHSHEAPTTLGDRFAYALAYGVDLWADFLFRDRYAHRALVLESIAAVPGMIGALLIQLRSARRLSSDHGMVRALVSEAENERMHLLVFRQIAIPLWWELAVIKIGQLVFVAGYFILYVLAAPVAHRLVAYLEENTIGSYSAYLDQLHSGRQRNAPAPPMAIAYWRLPPTATLIHVVTAIRDDEAEHRDQNHALARPDGVPHLRAIPWGGR
ncbi:MAG: alternative oxidase [Bryobacteraceae bacterium]